MDAKGRILLPDGTMNGVPFWDIRGPPSPPSDRFGCRAPVEPACTASYGRKDSRVNHEECMHGWYHGDRRWDTPRYQCRSEGCEKLHERVGKRDTHERQAHPNMSKPS